MSSRRTPIRVVVQSRKVPVGLTEVVLPYTTSYGLTFQTTKRMIRYDYVLDEGDREILEEVREAAESSGVPLEVIDLGKAGPVTRILRTLLKMVVEEAGVLPARGQISSVTGLTQIGQVRPHQH